MKKNLISISILIITWFYANYTALKWLFQAIIQASTLNLILVTLILSFVVIKIKQQNLVFKQLEITIIPLLLILSSSGGAIAISWLLNISQLKAVFFFLGLYGILGLFLDSLIWQKNLPTAILIAIILPHATQFSNGLGVPVRILTANVVEKILSQWHITAISSQEIVVLENGIAHIDAPCSGLKSLWTGLLFLLTATWLEGRIIGLKWVLVCASTITLLVVNNIIRVLILVILNHVINQPIFAKILHLPLGVLGFIFACSLSWLMLKFVPIAPSSLIKEELFQENHKIEQPSLPNSLSHRRGGIIEFLPNPTGRGVGVRAIYQGGLHSQKIIITSLIMLFLIMPQLQYNQQIKLAIAPLKFPETFTIEKLDLTPIEEKFFSNQEFPTIAEKKRFIYGKITGSLITVFSTSWQSHHLPEVCLITSGLKIDKVEKKQLNKDVLGRWLTLQNGQLSATYWLQSLQQTTDDLLLRMWAEITNKNHTWVLISIVFDHNFNPEDEQMYKFTNNIHQVINNSLNGEQKQ